MDGAHTNDGIARWRRIADQLERDIVGGLFADRLPPEVELSKRFSVNRLTIRKAIASLADRGLVRAEQGRGTFLNERQERKLTYPVGPTTRFTENIGSASKDPGGRVIGSNRELADAEIAQRLGCGQGQPLIRLEMLRVADTLPILVSTHWFVEERFAGIVPAYAETGTLTGALTKCGVPSYRRLRTEVAAETARSPDAERLQIAPGDPVLVTHSVDVDDEGTPIQTARTRFRADCIALAFEHAG
ncbi:phosphonate metabolism transcriptional regulator PhnF [Fulvimarina sp. 2208YS6-2-32]|uniref:Phosphonate metabolism transcriptional regulator PhnF n=1 Tax=Fulvimarina uroteuthidis TaxID=3098149 RepID=A0ABU5I3D3_9HYPH|nr:phosphonate metabolism transcriptional regulator PhnF [Fulvimarina sp. 2208YS6-2-32]MDY8109891.1 phosphonate metabolism transcriptional regulator PhnF [Fulvimarina sp. 2208YS6-2-32]